MKVNSDSHVLCQGIMGFSIPDLPRKHQKKYLDILQKRRDYLVSRISGSHKDLSYDKAEAAALSWAIGKLKAISKLEEVVKC